MLQGGPRQATVRFLSVVLCLFVLAEVNYPQLSTQSQLAFFVLFGLAITFLTTPAHRRFATSSISRGVDIALALATALVCGYVIVQNEPVFQEFWSDGRSLGNRAGAETELDHLVGIVGLLLILEAARRAVGFALPLLSLLFLAYGYWGQAMPNWLFPHRGYDLDRLVSQTFLHSQGVFGVALKVMFTYVFLFVVFGAFLEATGATAFVIEGTRRIFGKSAGGPAKVAVFSSGLMGSLSGSAVANTATTGTFTIPLMRSAGFRKHVAAGIEAAASSGGALVPPVMGAGAYMMLEIVQPAVTYVEIIRAAILPAVLYYLSLFLIVHFQAQRLMAPHQHDEDGKDGEGGQSSEDSQDGQNREDRLDAERKLQDPKTPDHPPGIVEGLIFLGSLGILVVFMLQGFTVFRSVSVALATTTALSFMAPHTRLTPKRILGSLVKAARSGIALIAAASSVGVVIGVVTLTGVGSKLPATILPLAESNLFLALLLIMVSSLVLGMGLPSAVCYLLLATLIGPALGDLGVVPLAAHFFIFYFGLMSMVTPPVALAAYTAASIANSSIMRTGVAAFRFAILGFVLPFLFVYKPALLMLSPEGGIAKVSEIAFSFLIAALALVPLAAAITGYFYQTLRFGSRTLLLLAAAGLLYPGDFGTWAHFPYSVPNLVGALLLGIVTMKLHTQKLHTQKQAPT
jgi:TRAP transporter 4TM/12TM fusion protein